MNLEPFIKNRNIIGVLTILVAGVLYIGFEMVSGGKVVSRLNEDHSFYLLIIGVFLSFMFLIVLTIIIFFRKDGISENQVIEKDDKKSSKKSEKILFVLFMVIGLIFGIRVKFCSRDKLIPVYVENFASNKYPDIWIEGRQFAGESYFQHGKYVMKVEKEFISRRIDLYRFFQFSMKENDFSAKINIHGLHGEDRGYGGFEWGADSKGSTKFGFYLNNNLEYSIKLYKHSNEIASYLDWTTGNHLIKSSSNVLEVVKRLSTTTFYLNGMEIFSVEDLPVLGDELGFGASANTVIEVDEILVSKYR